MSEYLLECQERAAQIMKCEPEQLKLIAVTPSNSAPKGCRPFMNPTAYFECSGVTGRDGALVRYITCPLKRPASIRVVSPLKIEKAMELSESARFNPNFPDLTPPLEQAWITPETAEGMGIDLANPLYAYEVIVGNPGHYYGIYREAGDRIITSHMSPYTGNDGHDVLMNNISHLRFR